MSKKCCLLVRVSTEKQSFDEQEKELYQMAVRDGYKDDGKHIIPISYKESAIKLNEEERQGLRDLKHYIETDTEINCVYCWEISRIARSKKVLFSIEDYLVKRHIQLIVKKPSLTLLEDDGSVNEGAETVFTLFGQIAESEMRNKKARFARGKKEGAAHNKFTGGNIPYGYKVNELTKKIEIDDETAQHVRLIYNLYEDGFSQPKIAKELDKRDISIKTSLINNILNNQSYCGIKNEEQVLKQKRLTETANGEKKSVECTYHRYPRKYPQIISVEQYERCRKIAKENNTTLSKAKNIYFAQGLIRCQTCGAKWSASGSKVAYHCYSAYKPISMWKYDYSKEKCTDKTSLSINILDSLLWDIAKRSEVIFSMEEAEEKIKGIESKIADCKKQCEKRKKLIKDIRDNINKATIKNIEGVLYDEAYNALLEKYKGQIKVNENEYSDLLNDQIRYEESLEALKKKLDTYNSVAEQINSYNAIVEILDNASDAEKFDIIHKHIKEVKVTVVPIMAKFAVGWRETHAKRISVISLSEFYATNDIVSKLAKEDEALLNKNRVYNYLFIPFNGKGGMMLEEDFNLSEGEREITQNRFVAVKYKDDDYQTEWNYHIVGIPYLNRFVDEGKQRRNSEKKLANKHKKEQAQQERVERGLFTLKEAESKFNVSYFTLWSAISRGTLKYTKGNKGVKLVSERDVQEYIKVKRNSPNHK